jgi:hypothetical protein
MAGYISQIVLMGALAMVFARTAAVLVPVSAFPAILERIVRSECVRRLPHGWMCRQVIRRLMHHLLNAPIW